MADANLPSETLKAIYITIPLKDIVPTFGYLALWSFKSYWFYYYCLLRSNIITMRVGNIFETLMMFPKGLVYAKFMVNYNLNKHRLTAYHAYMQLVGKPLNYNL